MNYESFFNKSIEKLKMYYIFNEFFGIGVILWTKVEQNMRF